MKTESTLYGVYKCLPRRSKQGVVTLSELRPIQLPDEGKQGVTKTVKIYPHEADIMNDGVADNAPRFSQVSKNIVDGFPVVYLTSEEFEELSGSKDEGFPVEQKPKKQGRPKKEENKSE